MSEPSLPSGWFPDPLGRHEHRYFNGATWTSDVSDDGRRAVDPFGTSPGQSGPSSNRPATAAVVMGSIAAAIAWIPFIGLVGTVLAVLAIVFGIRGLRLSRRIGAGRRSSIAGTIMGAVGVLTSIVGIVLTVIVWNAAIDFIEPGPVTTEVLGCTFDGRTVDIDGTLTNVDDVIRDYTVFVEIDGRREVVAVDQVGPGETVRWATVITTRSIVTSCEPDVIVQGPFPFGVEIDPVAN